MSKFWGLTVTGGKKFKQQVKEPFCISGAALEPVDINSGKYDDKPVLLYLQQEQNDFLLCSLAPSQGVLQAGLNLNIGSGGVVGFHLKGGSAKSKVHLTGFTVPKGEALVTPSPGQSKTVQKSILKTEPSSGDKQKKRVSIVETEAYGEREELESDEENPFADTAKQLFNGNADDSDEEDDDSDSEMSDEEIKELQQIVQKGKFNPHTGGKLGDSEDSDDFLDSDEDEDEDEDEDDDDDDDDDSDDDAPKEVKSPSQKQGGSPANNNTPNKDKKMNVNVNDLSKKQETPKSFENKQLQKVKTPSSAGQTPMKAFSKGGVLVNDMKLGNGQVAKSGKVVTVYYEGRLKSNNKRFDASLNGPGFKFRLGKGEVIKGWDLGVEGMKVGGKRKLVIPAQLAYGKRGAPPDIPPNSTLVFDVELKNVS